MTLGAFFFGSICYYAEYFEMVRWRARIFPANASAADLALLEDLPRPAFRDIGDAVWFIIVTCTTVRTLRNTPPSQRSLQRSLLRIVVLFLPCGSCA